ncbi:hypothetical protein J132_03489, partial [Termitomyces sp. J132]
DEDKLDSETLDHLQNPIEGTLDIIDSDERLSLELFTATNSSEATYNQCHSAILDSGILTFYKVKQLVANISGIVPVMDDMCINSCHAFTGPFADLGACTICCSSDSLLVQFIEEYENLYYNLDHLSLLLFLVSHALYLVEINILNNLRNWDNAEQIVISEKFSDLVKVRQWGCIHLPNGQIAWSIFNDKEYKRNTWISQNVKASTNIMKVFWILIESDLKELVPWAVVSVYSKTVPELLADSYGTIWACHNTGSDGLQVIPASNIISLVSMQPLPALPHEPQDLWFVVEKSSLKEVQLGED